MDRSIWTFFRQCMGTRRYKFRKGITVCCSIWILYVVWNIIQPSPTVPYVTTLPARKFNEKTVKKILLWTNFFSKSILQSEKECLSTCKVKCVVTDDKNDIADSDAINFHLSDLWTKFWSIGTQSVIQFPLYRRADQVWILSNMEPPPHLWGDLKIFDNVFNWTMWYRKDATIKWSYGSAQKLNETEITRVIKTIKGRNFYSEKSHEIIGRVSNCVDPGRRYRIIKELQRYLDIDMYGLCYNKPCGISLDQADTSCDQLMRKFKFYLAFENSACTDYITEKYWWALHRDQIPIVNWKKMDKRLPIPKSYINVFDFPDLKAFANYVKHVSANETLYNSYFDWKKSFKEETRCSACTVCHALHDSSRPAQVISNIDGWVRDDTCEKVGVFNNIMKQVHAWIFWNLGI